MALSEVKKVIEQSLDADKASDVEGINLKGQTNIADYMYIASGQSSRHVSSIAEKLIEKLKSIGIKDIKSEGLDQGEWVVVDTGDIIIHVFKPETREFYNIAKMWRSEQQPAEKNRLYCA